ncbi:MAG: hypothetical protein PHN56_06500 [Candidatus Nanoarchaeia archaeon]|nr:hypothetical protein [Candidatus Nanoarchaeia archaeon]
MNYLLKEQIKEYDNLAYLFSSFFIQKNLKSYTPNLINPVYIIPWFHNVVDSNLKKKSAKKDILNEIGQLDYLICEGPKNRQFHNLINNFEGSVDKFTLESKKILNSTNRASLYTLYSFLKVFPKKPVFIGINEKIPASLERDLFLCSSTYQTIKVLELNDNSSRIGVLIGQSHLDSISYYLNKKNVKTLDSFTVGKTSEYFPKEKNYFQEFSSLPDLEHKMKNTLKRLNELLFQIA